MRGRKPKPTAVKVAEGNPGKRPLNKDEPRLRQAELPNSPVIHREGGREAHAGTLYDMGVLTTVDRAALAASCQAYGRWVEAEKKLAEKPAKRRGAAGRPLPDGLA